MPYASTSVAAALPINGLGEPHAGAIDPALDGAQRAAADLGRFLIGKAGRAHQDEGLPLIGRKPGQGGAKLLKFNVPVLLGLRPETLRIAAVAVLDLAAALAIFGAELVVKDREQPGRHVRV